MKKIPKFHIEYHQLEIYAQAESHLAMYLIKGALIGDRYLRGDK